VAIGQRSQDVVWRDLEALGLDLYLQAIVEVKRGLAESKPQMGPRRSLCRDPKMVDILRFYWRQWLRRLPR